MNPLEYIKALDHHAYFIHAFKDSVQKLKDFLKKEFHMNLENLSAAWKRSLNN